MTLRTDNPPSVTAATKTAPSLQRASGAARVRFGARGLENLYQSGSAKILLPHTGTQAAEAVMVNTAGGMTGGDVFSWEAAVQGPATLSVTTQAAERLYKSNGGTARVEARLDVSGGGRLHWLPQELIVYDGGAMDRAITANVSVDSELLMVETMIFGRTAMKETVRQAVLSDQWRVHFDGHLLHGEAFRMAEPARELGSLGGFDGAIAMSTLVLVSLDAEDRLDLARRMLVPQEGLVSGASAWNGKLVVRLLGQDAFLLRKALIPLLAALSRQDLPKVWRL